MGTVEGLVGQISQAPDVLRGGIYWLGFINSAALLFIFTRTEARWIFAAWLAGLPLLALLFELSGFTTLLALVYLSIWAPLLCWLVWRNPVDGMREPWNFYLVLLFTSDLVALGLGSAGLFRYATRATGFA